MDELGFRIWLSEKGVPKKQIKDSCSRVKSIESTLSPNYDIEEEFKKDKCVKIMHLFDKKGALFKVCCTDVTLPIGQYYLSSYKLALRKYIEFLESITLIQ